VASEKVMPRKYTTIKNVVNYARSSRMHVANVLYARGAFCSNASWIRVHLALMTLLNFTLSPYLLPVVFTK